jgi:hypothetical protein
VRKEAPPMEIASCMVSLVRTPEIASTKIMGSSVVSSAVSPVSVSSTSAKSMRNSR